LSSDDREDLKADGARLGKKIGYNNVQSDDEMQNNIVSPMDALNSSHHSGLITVILFKVTKERIIVSGLFRI